MPLLHASKTRNVALTTFTPTSHTHIPQPPPQLSTDFYLQTIMSSYWDWLSPDLQRIILAHRGCSPVNTDFCSHPASRCQVTHVQGRPAVVDEEGIVLEFLDY